MPLSSRRSAIFNFSSAEKVMFSPWVPSLKVVSYRNIGSIGFLQAIGAKGIGRQAQGQKLDFISQASRIDIIAV
jgi:hypothetical protein